MNWNESTDEGDVWNREIKNKSLKQKSAKKLALRLQDGDVVGAGSGSTSFLTLMALAERRDKENIKFCIIPTSIEIELACSALYIPTTGLKVAQPNWSFDGADEVDKNNNLIKGRGGALLREKLLISASPEVYIVIDKSKRVSRLGENFPVPVEVYPDAIQLVLQKLSAFKNISKCTLRQAVAKDGPVITENGNVIFDVWFNKIPSTMEKTLKSIVGVVDSGLFIGYPVIIVQN